MPTYLSLPQCPARPFMSDAETACFARWIPQGGKALEFGMGGSTRFFFEQGLWSLTSVESDPTWVLALRQDPFLSFFLQKGRLNVNHADIGPVRGLGAPLRTAPQEALLRYHQDIWCNIDPKELNFILIDGRFRVACTCQTLLRCKKDAVILFHDFWNRNFYHIILDFVDVLESSESTAVLRSKINLDEKRVLETLHKFKYVYD